MFPFAVVVAQKKSLRPGDYLFVEVDDGPNAFAFVHEVKRFVDIFKAHGMSNKVAQLKLAF
ncbi:MAG: hypothetical protein ACI9SC_001012 [Gammaproteobacteria bacterium]